MPRRGPRAAIRRYGDEHELLRLTETENEGGTADPVFSAAEPLFASVHTDVPDEFTISDTGQIDAAKLQMQVLEKPPDMSAADAEADPAITYPRVENDDRVLFDGREWRAVSRMPATTHHFARFVLLEDLRGGGPDTGDGGSGGDGGDGGTTDPAPTGVLEDFETGDLSGYDGDKTNVTVAEDSRATETYGLAVRGSGAEIWRTTPSGEGPRTTRGSYYTFDAEAATFFSGDPQAVHLTLGVDPANGTVLGEGSGYLVSIAANQNVAIQSRPPDAPFESDITDTSSGTVPADAPITVETRWDDGSLGGADGDIAVTVYDETGAEAATATATDTSISSGTFGWVVEGGADPRSFVDQLRAEQFAP